MSDPKPNELLNADLPSKTVAELEAKVTELEAKVTELQKIIDEYNVCWHCKVMLEPINWCEACPEPGDCTTLGCTEEGCDP